MEVIIYYIYTQEKHDEILHIMQQKLSHLTQSDTVVIRCDDECIDICDWAGNRFIFLPCTIQARGNRGQIVLVPKEMKDTMWCYEFAQHSCNGLLYYYEEGLLKLPFWLKEQNS